MKLSTKGKKIDMVGEVHPILFLLIIGLEWVRYG